MVKSLAMVALLGATACTFPEQPLPPGEHHIIVHAILDPSSRYQLVGLSLTQGSTAKPTDLDQAAVVITTPGGTQLTARQDTLRDSTGKATQVLPSYRIDLQSAGVTLVGGGTYQLRITTRFGEVITGMTTIPMATPGGMAAPVPFNHARDTLHLSWAPAPGVRTHEVQVWLKQTYTWTYNGVTSTFTNTRLEHTAFADSSITLAGTAKNLDGDIFRPDATAMVYVYAVDENYYEYYRNLGDPFIGAAPSRLQGGLGVFGSVVPVIQRQLDVK